MPETPRTPRKSLATAALGVALAAASTAGATAAHASAKVEPVGSSLARLVAAAPSAASVTIVTHENIL